MHLNEFNKVHNSGNLTDVSNHVFYDINPVPGNPN